MQKRSDALDRARVIAQDSTPDPEGELHVAAGHDHAPSAKCWCEPEIFYRDPDTGVTVYDHRRTQ